MRLEKAKTFLVSSTFHGALTKKNVDKALKEVDEDFDHMAS